MNRRTRHTPSDVTPRAAAWLAERPDIVRDSYPWVVFSFGSLEGLDERDLTVLALALGYFTPETLAEQFPDASRGDLVAVIAGWPWTAELRKEELDAPPDVAADEVVWWLEDLLRLLQAPTEQQLIEYVRDELRPWLSTIWSAEDALRIDVLDHNRTSRLEFRYPFSLDTFRAALQFPFDAKRYAWMSPLELKELAVEMGYAISVEQLDDLGFTVTDIVGWFVSRDICADEGDDDGDDEDHEMSEDVEIRTGDDATPARLITPPESSNGSGRRPRVRRR